MRTLLIGVMLVLSTSALCAQGWQPQVSGVQYGLNSVAFVDVNNGWTVGNGLTILHTMDAGLSWTQSPLPFFPSSSSYYMTKVLFTTRDEGWIFGREGLAYRTTNAGVRWETVALGSNDDIYGGFFISPQRGWVVGDRGVILATTDRGVSWMQQSRDSCNWLYGVSFADSLHGWAVGAQGIIMATIDGGVHWRVSSRWMADWLADVTFMDGMRGWVTGDSASVFATTDGGITWTVQTRGAALTAWDIEFTDSLHGWIAGGTPPGRSSPPLGLILRTTNGGRSWVQQQSGTDVCLFGFCFVDTLTGWVVGEAGTILHTETGGVTHVLPSIDPVIAGAPQLEQNYPNPFNGSTLITFSIPRHARVSLKVFDMIGREVGTLAEGEFSPGTHSARFSDDGLRASGIYYCQLNADWFVKSTRMILLK